MAALAAAAGLVEPAVEPPASTVVGPLLEDGVVKEGLQRLRDAVGDADLLVLPKRPSGAQLLLKQGHFERLLSGTLDLLSFPMADVVDMQADIKHLTLSQLLYVKCSNLGFAATTQSVRAQGDFLDKVDAQLDIRLAARLAGGRREFTVEPSKVPEVARLAYLIYGACQQVKGAGPDSVWLFRAGPLEGALRLKECQLEPLGQSQGVFCHRSLARNPAGAARARRQLHWEVQVSDSPATFDSTPPARPSRAQNLVRPSQRQAEASGGGAEGYPVPEGVPPHVRAQMEQALAAAAAARQEADQSASELDEAKRELESVRAELAAAKASAEAAAGAAEAAAAALRAQLASAEGKLSEEKQRRESASAEAEQLRKQISEVQADAEAAAGARAAAEAAAESLRAELATAKADAEAAAGARAAAEAAAESLRAELATAKADAEAAAGARAAAEAATESLRAELATAQAAVAQLGSAAAGQPAGEAARAPATAAAPPGAPGAAAAAAAEAPASVPEEILRAFPGAQVVVQPMAHSR